MITLSLFSASPRLGGFCSVALSFHAEESVNGYNYCAAGICVVMDRVGESSATQDLSTPVQFLTGVGPDRAKLLTRIGLSTAADVLFCFPRDYIESDLVESTADLTDDAEVRLCGVIEEVDLRDTGSGRSVLGLLIKLDAGEYFRALWFNQPFMQKKLKRGERWMFSGKAKLNGGRWEMVHPRIEPMQENDEPTPGHILPIYRLTDGLRQASMRRLVRLAVEHHAGQVEEVFPNTFLDTHNLWPIQKALPQIHQPTDRPSLEAARRRFVYQEMLVLQLALAMRRRSLVDQRRAFPLPLTGKIDARIRNRFPFELTADQDRSIAEVTADLALETPMNRLLQGEVGSGKTVVAIYAMLLAVAHGRMAALMVPTEILARQHFRTVGTFLEESKVRVALLVGSLTAGERRETLAKIEAGEIDVVIGTQSIIASDLAFPQLGLVVIDEQHKFGVQQRATLRQAGLDPHYLVMTATPIPRTVAMTLFGDLDVSSLRHPPPGRQPVHTYLADDSQRDRWWTFFRRKLDEGCQGFVVAPLVEESEENELASAEQLFETLSNGELSNYWLELVHGRMAPEEKDRAMQAFEQGKTQVLVATQVVEVGIDVKNATLMVIEGAERFGLAQLHQLRGRVCRGERPGMLCLFADPKTEASKKRLQAIVDSTDGFTLAEIDFSLRGPGDLFGTKQHGMPPMRIADLQRDTDLLMEARRDAQSLVADDGDLSDPSLSRLRRMVLARYGQALELGDVG